MKKYHKKVYCGDVTDELTREAFLIDNSGYHAMIGQFLRKISQEEKLKPAPERASRSDRMRRAQQMYRDFKKLEKN